MFVITGGGSGIGRALALLLAQRGLSVCVVGRREASLKEVVDQSPSIIYCCTDVSRPEGRTELVKFLKNTPKIDALINNAGTVYPIIPLKTMQLEDWHQAFHTNVDAALALPQDLYTQLAQGRVLNIGTGAAYFPIVGCAAYCSSKAALALLTRCWQEESDTIAFASVMPGIVDTAMQMELRLGEHVSKDQLQFYKSLEAKGQLLAPETVALFLTWLLLEVDEQNYSAQEWDIYDTSHHPAWLKSPHQVRHWENT